MNDGVGLTEDAGVKKGQGIARVDPRRRERVERSRRSGRRGDGGRSRAQLHYTPSLISGISGLQHDVLCSRRINESEVK